MAHLRIFIYFEFLNYAFLVWSTIRVCIAGHDTKAKARWFWTIPVIDQFCKFYCLEKFLTIKKYLINSNSKFFSLTNVIRQQWHTTQVKQANLCISSLKLAFKNFLSFIFENLNKLKNYLIIFYFSNLKETMRKRNIFYSKFIFKSEKGLRFCW